MAAAKLARPGALVALDGPLSNKRKHSLMAPSKIAPALGAHKCDISIEEVRSLLHYDANEGILIWRERPQAKRGWNRKYAGKTAGHLTKCGPKAGYVTIRICGSSYLAHRLAWLHFYGEWPASDIDHKDANKANNRISNLRKATQSQNETNKRLTKANTSGAKGVCWDSYAGRWKAQLHIGGRTKNLGRFDTVAEAKAAYDRAANIFFGEFARA